MTANYIENLFSPFVFYIFFAGEWGGKKMKIIFTGNYNISKDVWRIIGQADLIEEKITGNI